ncbi:MAG TPA: hypothetical protein VFC19_38320 [Candidatus Limnocylindrales bacterium]|nr:hypothetical protein [Candidatus Limnocylindrales bacterium]
MLPYFRSTVTPSEKPESCSMLLSLLGMSAAFLAKAACGRAHCHNLPHVAKESQADP